MAELRWKAKSHDAQFRTCSVVGCEYTEHRGSRTGAFYKGKFVCEPHYDELVALNVVPTFDERSKSCKRQYIKARGVYWAGVGIWRYRPPGTSRVIDFPSLDAAYDRIDQLMKESARDDV